MTKLICEIVLCKLSMRYEVILNEVRECCEGGWQQVTKEGGWQQVTKLRSENALLRSECPLKELRECSQCAVRVLSISYACPMLLCCSSVAFCCFPTKGWQQVTKLICEVVLSKLSMRCEVSLNEVRKC